MLAVYFLALCLLGSALAQNNNIQDITKQVNETLNGVSQDQVDKLVDSGKEAFKTKCIENNATEAYEETLVARTELEACIHRNVNMTEIQEQIKLARPKGTLDEVFKKYCDRKDALEKCLKDFTIKMEPCLKASERENLLIVHNVTEQIVNFVCHKDGERIALFIAEDGPECLSGKTDLIQKCVTDFTQVKNISLPGNDFKIEDVSNYNLEFTGERCDNLRELQACVVSKLCDCSQPTPSNMAESLFKFVIKATPCHRLTAVKSKQVGERPTNSAPLLNSALATMGSAIALLALI